MVFTLTFYEDYWLVQRNYLWDFKLSFLRVMWLSILLWTYLEVCKSKDIWYQSKDKQIEWHLKWAYWKDQCKRPRGGWIGLQNKLDQFLPTSAQTSEPSGFSLEPPGKCTSVYFSGASRNSFLWWFAVWNKITEQQYSRKLVTRA
jgi:hypothetical protein